MIHVLATIELRPGARDAFLQEFNRLVPQVWAEDGCLEYGPAVDVKTDIPAQQPVGENAVVVIEKWASVEALKAHLAAPHMAEYRQRVASLVAAVRLQVLRPAFVDSRPGG